MYEQIYIDGIKTYVLDEEMLELIQKDTSVPEKFQKCVEWHLKHDGQIRDISEVKLQPAVLHNERYDLWVPATSMQSGVWTFYEACPPDEVRVTLEYLQQSDTEELARMFALGIHDYQNPKYAENFGYPQEWMDEAEQIDAWIMKHEGWLNEWKKQLLLKHREEICSCEML